MVAIQQPLQRSDNLPCDNDRMRDKDDMKGDRTASERQDPMRPARSGVLYSPKFWIGAVLAILFVVFIAENHDLVTVHFIFFTKDSYLIWVMLLCGVIGFVVGWLWGRPHRVEEKHRGKDAKKD
jgi:uncharacterized integral membrane protein